MATRSSSVELDFFSMERESSILPSAARHPVFQRRRSFRDIQAVISKMNPEVVKNVIENGGLSSNKSFVSVSSTPKKTQTGFAPLPVYDPKLSLRCGRENNAENTAPMTIFYKGMVSVYEVPPRKAQDIIKYAEEKLSKSAECSKSNSCKEKNLLESLNGDLPISRANSLQRFLEKRKERVEIIEDIIT